MFLSFKCGLRFLRCTEERVSGSFLAGPVLGLRHPSQCSWAEACWRPAPAGLEDGGLCSAEHPRYRGGRERPTLLGRQSAPHLTGEAGSAPRYRERAQRRGLPGCAAGAERRRPLTAVCCPQRWPQRRQHLRVEVHHPRAPGLRVRGRRVLPRYHLHTGVPLQASEGKVLPRLTLKFRYSCER